MDADASSATRCSDAGASLEWRWCEHEVVATSLLTFADAAECPPSAPGGWKFPGNRPTAPGDARGLALDSRFSSVCHRGGVPLADEHPFVGDIGPCANGVGQRGALPAPIAAPFGVGSRGSFGLSPASQLWFLTNLLWSFARRKLAVAVAARGAARVSNAVSMYRRCEDAFLPFRVARVGSRRWVGDGDDWSPVDDGSTFSSRPGEFIKAAPH